jgi:PilZ domain
MGDPGPDTNRRRTEREPAVWIGSCHVEGDPTELWRDCGVFDVSALGLGMDLRHAADLVERHISVRLRVGASLDVTLTGEVRNAKAGPGGVTRVGVEFVDLSETEHALVDQLIVVARSRS